MSNDPMAEFRQDAELAAIAAVSALQTYGVTNKIERVTSLDGLMEFIVDVCKGVMIGPDTRPPDTPE